MRTTRLSASAMTRPTQACWTSCRRSPATGSVPGPCMMTRREPFEEVGGFSTTFPVNYNDMDYCLKLRAGGRRVVYDPDTVLYHFESSSRSTDVEDWEKERLVEKWLHLTKTD